MIYICIPAHNEASTIGLVVWKIRKVMGEFGRDYQIRVFDDASDDGTSEALSRYERFLPIKVTRSETQVGYPGAVEALIRSVVDEAPYPKRDVVVTLQGDFSQSPANIPPLIRTLEGGADIVAAVPAESPDRPPRAVRFTRWAAGLLLGGTMQAAPVSDPLGGFRAYRIIVLKKALRELDQAPLISETGWAANLELLGMVAPHARRIEEAQLETGRSHQVRPSRFRALPTLQGLFRIRKRVRWDAPAS